ncbi:MAG: GGDEF domain-containing protein [Magnetococcales bacterium]|nr:GGDEF domain-containing protein [Magnetococcales bacterium]
MARTFSSQLEKMLGLLNRDKPDPARALSLVKEWLVKEPWVWEKEQVFALLAAVLEQVVKPPLAGELDKQSQVDRFYYRALELAPPYLPALEGELREMGGWFLSAPRDAASSGSAVRATEAASTGSEGTPEALWLRVLAALRSLGSGEPWLTEAVDRFQATYQEPTPAGWEVLSTLLGQVVLRADLDQTARRNERGEMRELLQVMASQFAQTLEGIGQMGGALGEAAQRLSASHAMTDMTALRDLLLQESALMQQQARSMGEQLQASRQALEKSRKRMEAAEKELLRSREDNLQDPATGLPNRFAFAGHLQRVGDRRRALGEGYGLLALRLKIIAGPPGVEREGGRLMAALVKRVQAELPEGALLARLEEMFLGIILPAAAAEAAVPTAERLRKLIGQLRFKLSGEMVAFRGGAGVAAGGDDGPGEAWRRAREAARLSLEGP